MDSIIGILMTLGVLGLAGFVLYWFGVSLKAGLKKTKDDINEDERFR